MKNTIMYYYNIDNLTIYVYNHRTYIKTTKKRYIVQPIISEAIINEIYDILSKYKIKDEYYKIIETREKKLSFNYKGMQYAVLELDKEATNIEKVLKKIEVIKNKYLLDRSNWYFLWREKADYIYDQTEKIKQNNKILSEFIDYYIGMTETAISYLKYNTNIFDTNRRLNICHKKIRKSEIRNPLNIIIDSKERDVSEYLKYLFINKVQSLTKTQQVLKNISLTPEELKRLYARMIYPSYFYDEYDKYATKESNEEKLLELTTRIDEYECYLREIYNEISKIIDIKKVEWL